MTNALPQYQPQEMLSHTLNAVEQNLPLGGHISGEGWEWKERTKFHGRKERRKEEMARWSTSVKYLLNEEEYCLLCYSERTGRLCCPNSTPANMGSLISEMHFSQVNGA